MVVLMVPPDYSMRNNSAEFVTSLIGHGFVAEHMEQAFSSAHWLPPPGLAKSRPCGWQLRYKDKIPHSRSPAPPLCPISPDFRLQPWTWP